MDFFALVGGRRQSVFRMELERRLQRQLEGMFSDQADVIVDADLEVVPFERENFKPDETEVLEINPFELPRNIREA